MTIENVTKYLLIIIVKTEKFLNCSCTIISARAQFATEIDTLIEQ